MSWFPLTCVVVFTSFPMFGSAKVGPFWSSVKTYSENRFRSAKDYLVSPVCSISYRMKIFSNFFTQCLFGRLKWYQRKLKQAFLTVMQAL